MTEINDEAPKKGDTGEKLVMAGVIALIVGVGLALWGLNKSPQPTPAVTSTDVVTSTTATPTTMTKTETRTETPPARTVTETQVARSSQRGPVKSQTPSQVPSDTSTTPVNESTPEPVSTPAPNGGKWDRLAQCEAGGDWSINTGNGYSGGIQASPSTWAAFGGTKYAPTAGQATKAQQIEIGEKILAGQGPGAWPVCSQKTGLN